MSQPADAVTPTPMQLWNQANATCPDDPVERRVLYHDLMRVWGHIVPREDGDDQPSFKCGESMKEWLDDDE